MRWRKSGSVIFMLQSPDAVAGSVECRPPVREVACLLLFYTIATIFLLYLISDKIYEMRRRMSEPS